MEDPESLFRAGQRSVTEESARNLAASRQRGKEADKASEETRLNLLPLYAKIAQMFDGSAFFVFMSRNNIDIGFLKYPLLELNKISKLSLKYMKESNSSGECGIITNLSDKYCSVRISLVSDSLFRIYVTDIHMPSILGDKYRNYEGLFDRTYDVNEDELFYLLGRMHSIHYNLWREEDKIVRSSEIKKLYRLIESINRNSKSSNYIIIIGIVVFLSIITFLL